MHAASCAQIADILDDFIRERFQVRPDDSYFTRETDLWSEGYLDSLGIVELVQFIEDSFPISIPSEMLFDPDFVCINGMARLVNQLSNGTVAAAEQEPATFPR
jgi:acyl carrier protein